MSAEKISFIQYINQSNNSIAIVSQVFLETVHIETKKDFSYTIKQAENKTANITQKKQFIEVFL